MIRRTYFATCDTCKEILKDDIFKQYFYCDSLSTLEKELTKQGWTTEHIPGHRYKKDTCPKCQ